MLYHSSRKLTPPCSVSPVDCLSEIVMYIYIMKIYRMLKKDLCILLRPVQTTHLQRTLARHVYRTLQNNIPHPTLNNSKTKPINSCPNMHQRPLGCALNALILTPPPPRQWISTMNGTLNQICQYHHHHYSYHSRLVSFLNPIEKCTGIEKINIG